jgi:hypothetical protein
MSNVENRSTPSAVTKRQGLRLGVYHVIISLYNTGASRSLCAYEYENTLVRYLSYE